MIYVAQEAAKHKPIGPFWTGKFWAQTESRKIYSTVDEAAGEARQARLTAVRPVVVMDGNVIALRLKVTNGV